MTPMRFIALAAAAIVTLAACAPGGSSVDASSDPDDASVATASSVAPEDIAWANPDAPDIFKFMATDLVTGEPVDGTALVGKDAILWFWASWCPVCAAESGVWVKAQADFPEGTQFLGIAGLSDATSAQGFVSEHGMEQFSHIYDEDGSIWRNFGVTSQPTMILINQDGRAKTYGGAYGYYDLVEKIAWLGES